MSPDEIRAISARYTLNDEVLALCDSHLALYETRRELEDTIKDLRTALWDARDALKAALEMLPSAANIGLTLGYIDIVLHEVYVGGDVEQYPSQHDDRSN